MNLRYDRVLSVSYAGITRIRFQGLEAPLLLLSQENSAPLIHLQGYCSPLFDNCQAFFRSSALSRMNCLSQSPASSFCSAKSMIDSR